MRVSHHCLLGSLTAATIAFSACSGTEAQQPRQGGAQGAVPVTVASVTTKAMPLEVDVVGTAEAYSSVAVRAQITGELTSVNFRQGEDVQAGQVLFTLDRRPLEAALSQAEFAAVAEREHGKTPTEAIHEACLVRFRPIMMTTMCALVGTLPIALGWGAGAESRRPLGLTVVGGLLVSQLLTLYITPVYYVYIEGARLNLSRRRTAPAHVQAPDHTPSASPEPAITMSRSLEDSGRA